MGIERIVIIGAGGFAREVRWLISEINAASLTFEFVGFIVSDPERVGEHDSREDILGGYGWLDEHPEAFDSLALGFGNAGARAGVGRELETRYPSAGWPALIHPSVRFDRESCEIGHGVLLCAGVIGTVHLVIEPFAMVNLSCTLGHEARLGSGTVLNPDVNISGGVELGSGVLVGTGAQILQYVRVGEGATIGAGAVVTQDVGAGRTVVGIPARPLRKKEP